MVFNLLCFCTCIMSTLAVAPPIQISPGDSYKKSCQNGGTLTSKGSGSSTKCNCPEGYTGNFCQIRVNNPCSSNPCLNGGKCEKDKYTKGNGSGNDKYKFKCTCAPGFTGITCAEPQPNSEMNVYTTPAQIPAVDQNIINTESVIIDYPTYPPEFDPTTAKEAPHRKPRRSTSWSTTVLPTVYTDMSSELITVPSGMKSCGRVRRKSYIPDFNGVCWSPWFSDDNTSLFTSTDLEIETISVLQIVFPNQTCDAPSDIQCRTVDTHIPYNDTFENVLCILEYGLQCRQIRDVMCSDYEIRIACPCNINEDAVTNVYETVENTKVANPTVKSSTVGSSTVESSVSEESFSEFSSSDYDYAATGFHETIAGGVTSQENTTAQTTVTVVQPIMTKYDQSTSTPLVTVPESGEEKCWSPWLDDERLGISTDSQRVETEKISTFRRYDATLACPEPERIQCRKIVDKTPAGDEVTRCDVTFGLQCVGSSDNDCADYEIRLLCPLPCHPNGTLFTITSPAPPVELFTTIQHKSEKPVPTVDEGTTLTPGNIQATTTIIKSESSVPYKITTANVYTQNSETGTANQTVEDTTIVHKTSKVSTMQTTDADQSSSNMPDGITTKNLEIYSTQQTEMKTTENSMPKTQSNTPTSLTEGLTTNLEQGSSDTGTPSVTKAGTITPHMDITEKNTIGIPMQTTNPIIKRTTPVDTIISTTVPSTELPLTADSTLPTTPEDTNVISRTIETFTSSRVDVSTDEHNTITSTYKATNLFTTEPYTTAKETLAITNTQVTASVPVVDLRTTDSTTNQSDISTIVSKPTEHSLTTNKIGRTDVSTTQPETTIEKTSSTLLESNTVTELHPLNQSCESVGLSCLNGGTCFRKNNVRLKCNCTNGWEGKDCSKDNQAPLLECPPNIKRVIISQYDTRNVSWPNPTVTDNDVKHNSTVRSNVTFGMFSVGKVIVEFTAEDFAGNVAKPCTFKIVLFVGCKYNENANLTWRRVEINKERSSQETCPEGTPRAGMPKGTRYCGSDDDGNAMWMPPVIQDCYQSITTTSKTTEEREEELVNLSEATVTMDNVTEVADELTLLTDGVDEISENMFNAIADTLDNIVNVGSTSLEVTEAVFSAVSNVLSADMGNAHVASSSTKIVKAVDTQVVLAQQGQGSFQVQAENLAVLANTNNRSVVDGGLGFASTNTDGRGDSLANNQLENFLNANLVPSTGVDVSCKVPEEIGQYIGSGDLQISYVIFSNGMLFSSPSTSGANSSVEVMSRVLSVSVPDTQVTNLQDPVTMSFGIPPSKSNYDNATCVYWDFTLQNGIGDWSSDGCVINSTTEDVIICDCNHLTHFAVLIEFKKKDVPTEVLFALTLISRVGCLVSIACLTATLIAFLSFKRLRCERPQRILISLSVSLLCLYIMFIIGVEPGDLRKQSQETKCMVSAVLLHYFTLTSVFWMVVEAVNLYYNLIKVFKSKVSLFMLKASIFAWGVPALIVGAMAGWQTTREYYFNDSYCFMAVGYPFYLTIALPVAVCLAFNIIVFMRVMCELMCRRKQPTNSVNNVWKNMSKRAQNALGISVLLGLTWVFGFLTFDIDHDYVFDVVFCVLNSLQGVFVFIFFCVRQKEVRVTWRKFLCCQTQATYNIGSSTGSSTRYTNRSGRPASANIDLLAKPHHEGIQNGRVAAAIYDYNKASRC